MFYYINDIDKDGELIYPIDNTNGNLKVGLKSITYTVGWYNIHRWVGSIKPGLYSFSDLKLILEDKYKISLVQNRFNGTVTMTDKASVGVDLGDTLNNLFKFPKGSHSNVTSSGPIEDLGHLRNLHVHLRQLDFGGIKNGRLVDLLKVVRLENHYSFGEIKTVEYEFPEMVPLQRGMISGLHLSIKDHQNIPIYNHGLPISVVLKISDGVR